jgi:hypothetical protein
MDRKGPRLVKETLTDLEPEDLRRAAAGTDPTDLCNPCIFTWSCDEFTKRDCLSLTC